MTLEKEITNKIDATFVLNEILQKINSNAEHIDVQINSLVILSSAVFVFSAQYYLSSGSSQNIYALILAIFSSLASIVGLLALNPPRFMDKKGQKESALYVRHIASYTTQEEYSKKLCDVVSNEENVTDEYALEIYNLSKYSYLPKRNLFNMAKNYLIAGFLISLVMFLLKVRL
jgi:hypothetical protein